MIKTLGNPRRLAHIALSTLGCWLCGGVLCGVSFSQETPFSPAARPARGGAAEAAAARAEAQKAPEGGKPSASPTPPAAGAAPTEPKKVKVKDASGNITEITLPPNGKPPEGFTLVDDPAKAGDNAPVKRTNEPPAPPDKKEFTIRPDEQGFIEFNFRNQPWPDLLKWLAEISGMTLDWQELPGDYLNIATQRKYTIEEARDLFNQFLLARGYTMLESEGMLQIAKTEGINVSLVPKVSPQALDRLPNNRYVRTSFRLETLMADDVLDELQTLKSKNGQLFALTTTNRIEGMDSVANLREIKRILDAEQSEEVLDNMAKEYPLTYVRAADAKDQLEIFLGMKQSSTSTNAAINPQQLQQALQPVQQAMQQIQQQMQQQQAGARGAAARGGRGPRGTPPEIRIVADNRRNCLIVSAEPSKRGMIAAFLKRFDVPGNSGDALAMQQPKVYRLASLDPEQLVRTIQQMDILEPTTRLEVDRANKAMIVVGSLADQYAVSQLLQRLDGSARNFDVIQLRRLRADTVVGTIKLMMGLVDESKQNNRNSIIFYDPYSGRANPNNQPTADKFRVEPNVEDNQVLIWANEIERKEINKLLVKMGELPPEGGNASPYRTIDASRNPETFEYLKKLQEQWKQLNPNTPLIIPDEKLFEAPADSKPDKPAESEDPNKPGAKPAQPQNPPRASNNTVTSARDLGLIGPPKSINESAGSDLESSLSVAGNSASTQGRDSFVQFRGATANESDANGNADSGSQPPPNARGGLNQFNQPGAPPANSPVKIVVDSKGNLVIYSEDPKALDQLEKLMEEFAPPKRRHEVIYIKYDVASWIASSLEKYFKNEEDQPKSDQLRLYEMAYGFGQDTKKEPQLGVAKKRQLKFLSDPDTNTIIVMGADEPTMKTIRELVKVWDVPDKLDERRFRYSKLVKVQYSSAESVVETIKEAYRDLLSGSDKTFQQQQGGEGGGRGGGGGSSGPRSSLQMGNGSSVTESGDGLTLSFSGRLSFGVDKITNSILISAEGKPLLALVENMITELDKAAQPSGNIEIVRLDGSTGNEAVTKALQAILGIQSETQQPATPAQPDQNNRNQNQGRNGQNFGNRGGQRNGNQQRGRGGNQPTNARAQGR